MSERLRADNGSRIILNLHGHAHAGAPADKLSNDEGWPGVRVLNPGSLKYGECAELVLKKGTDGLWAIAQYNKHYLH